MSPLHARILELWREGKTNKEIAAELPPGIHWQQSRISLFICIARDLLGEEVVPVAARHTPDALLDEVAQLWRDGLSAREIADRTGREDADSLVVRARKRFGIAGVPVRMPPKPEKTPGMITMLDAGRHYLRRVGDEYIFRNDEGHEEIWVAGDKGLVFSTGNRNTPLVFKCRMGMTEKRSVA